MEAADRFEAIRIYHGKGLKVNKVFKIIEYRNEIIVRSQFPFKYSRMDHPKLVRLREQYKLDKIVKGARNQFEKFIVLRDYVRSRWKAGPDKIDTYNALSVLKAAQEGREFCCSYSATIFIQCCLSLGLQARYLGITKDNTDFISHIPEKKRNYGHSVTEVWSDDYKKWVLMDPDLNVHYEHSGIPCNAYEIRMAWLKGYWKKVKQVRGKIPFVHSGRSKLCTPVELRDILKEFNQYKTMDYYHHIAVHNSNGFHLSRWPGQGWIVWVDEYAPPQIIMGDYPVPDCYHFARRIEDLYWTLNQVSIHMRCPTKKPSKKLIVNLENSMPRFGHYLVRFNGKSWKRKENRFIWRLNEGENIIEAKPTDEWENEGIVSRVIVKCQNNSAGRR